MTETDSRTKIDRTLVKCPNRCFLFNGFGKGIRVSRQFRWIDEADADVGTRNYCEQCGAELIKAQND